MLETTDNIKESNFILEDIKKFWQPTSDNIYEECLKGFFPYGINFNGSILTSSKILAPDLTEVYTNIGNTTEKLNKKVALAFKLKAFGEFTVELKLSDTESVNFTISPLFGTIVPNESELYTIDKYTYNNKDYIFYIEFTPIELAESGYLLTFTDFTPQDFPVLKEYIFREPNIKFLTNGLAQLDSSDLCAFLWLANKGIILDKKIFSSKSLIENKFNEIDFVKKINYNEYIKNETYQDLLNKTQPGDIYVFNQNDIYHSIFIIDPIKHYYTECSSRVEYELGAFYNGKINSYDFERRIKSLAENSILYQVRLN